MSGSEATGDGAVNDTNGYPVIGSVHTLTSDGFLTVGYMSVMVGICRRVIGSDANQGLRPTP
jgi:hypothetical protein